MRRESILGLLIFCELAMCLATVVSDHALRAFLPGQLREYLSVAGRNAFRMPDVLFLVVWATMVVATIVGWIGLLNYWKPARAIYAVSWAATLAYTVLAGPIVRTSVGGTFDSMTALVGGLILGLIFFSDLKDKFRDSPEFLPNRTAGQGVKPETT
jgi:hypothetical protein